MVKALYEGRLAVAASTTGSGVSVSLSFITHDSWSYAAKVEIHLQIVDLSIGIILAICHMDRCSFV